MDVTDFVAAGRQRVIGFADVVRIPLRRWQTLVAVTAAAVLAVLAYLIFLPATYQATTVVVLRPVVTDPFTLPSSGADRAINMTAENGVAQGNDVVDATAQVLGRSADDVRKSLSVEVPTGGQVLRFIYADDSEQKALMGANAAAQAYLRVREGIYEQQRAALLLSYDNTIRQVSDQRKAAQQNLPGFPGQQAWSPRVQAMLGQVTALNDQIAQLANQRAKIASADLSPGAITAPARPPVPSSRDAAPLLLIAALLGGALLGVIAAHAREALDRRIRSVGQATDLVGVAPLGVVRTAHHQHGGRARAAADARYVSLAVRQWIDRHPDGPLVLLSTRDDEDRTWVTGHIAVALAENGRSVVLAATAERRDELWRILHESPGSTLIKRDPGTDARVNGDSAESRTPAMAGKSGASDDPEATLVMGAQSITTALLAPSGGVGGSTGADSVPPLVRVGTGTVRLCTLGEQPSYGLVLVDAPQADADERGVGLAQSGVAVLVIGRDRTRNAELARLVDRLRSAGAPIAGFVLTGERRD